MSKHRAPVRPRWGRIVLTAAAAAVVLVAVLAGFGVFSPGSDGRPTATDPAAHTTPVAARVSSSPSPSASASVPVAPSSSPAAENTVEDTAADGSAASSARVAPATALPAGSGHGRRAVFDQSDQRVWIVDANGKVQRTYRVSGSDENNLRPGTYSVYSRSRWAVGIDDSGVMQYFVRFAHGTDNGAAIGFHSIPTKGGKPLQTVAQLGQRLSHGCIRQKTSDAIAMWSFGQVGTKVVVVA